MNSKINRKRRTDRNQVIYYIQDTVTLEYYIGLTAVCFAGNVRKTLTRRMERFVFGVVEVVRGKRPAHSRETELINTLQPALNTFGVK